MTHALAAYPRVSDLYAATVADHPLVLHAPILTAGALPVLFRSENSLAKQTVLFRSVGSVVDRLGFLYFAKRPTANILRAGKADLDGCKIVYAIVTGFSCRHEPRLLSLCSFARSTAPLANSSSRRTYAVVLLFRSSLGGCNGQAGNARPFVYVFAVCCIGTRCNSVCYQTSARPISRGQDESTFQAIGVRQEVEGLAKPCAFRVACSDQDRESRW